MRGVRRGRTAWRRGGVLAGEKGRQRGPGAPPRRPCSPSRGPGGVVAHTRGCALPPSSLLASLPIAAPVRAQRIEQAGGGLHSGAPIGQLGQHLELRGVTYPVASQGQIPFVERRQGLVERGQRYRQPSGSLVSPATRPRPGPPGPCWGRGPRRGRPRPGASAVKDGWQRWGRNHGSIVFTTRPAASWKVSTGEPSGSSINANRVSPAASEN